MLNNPVCAVLWQCWRSTRRTYGLLLGVAMALYFVLMDGDPPGQMPPALYFEMQAGLNSMLMFMLAHVAALIALMVNGRAGFPLRFEYRLPVNSWLLTAMPLFYMCSACAALYVIPVFLGNVIYDVSAPLAAPAMLLAVVAAAFAAAGWCTNGTATRTLAVVAAGMGLLQMYDWLRPFGRQINELPNGVIRGFSVVTLDRPGYILLALLLVLLLVFLVVAIDRLRRSESLLTRAGSAGKQSYAVATATLPVRPGRSASIEDIMRLPCPVGATWTAELWLELKRYGIRVLMVGVLLAVALPALVLVATLLDLNGRGTIALLPVVAAFFAGIGIAFINRRHDSGGYMNSFEGTRGISTLQLAGIQFLVASLTTLIGVLLTLASLWLALPLLDNPGPVISKVQEVMAGRAPVSALTLAGEVVVAVMLFVATIAFLVCLYVCSILWGRKVLYGTLVFAIYWVFFIVGVINQRVQLQDLQQHMWGFAAVILAGTLLISARVLYLKLLSRKLVFGMLLAWSLFLLSAWTALQGHGVELRGQASELQAFNAALLVLPLTLFLLTTWCYDRLRHR